MLEAIQNSLHYALIALAVGGVTLLMKWRRKPRKPDKLPNGKERISPGKTSAIFTVVGGAAMAIGGFSMLIFGADDRIWGLLLMVMGVAIGGFMLPSLFSIHDVIWNENHIEGPSKMFGPTLGRQRAKIEWHDISKVGIAVTQYWYVETADRKRIYWSYLYPGYQHFHNALFEKTGLTP